MFNILVVIFMFSIIMLLFFLINIIAKFINNRSIGKSVVMINLFFIITNISFISGGVFFAKQNNMTVFNDIKITDRLKNTTDATKIEIATTNTQATEQAPTAEVSNTQIETTDSVEIDWDLVISDTLHDAKNKLSYEYLSIDLDNISREFHINIVSPNGQTEETILYNITTILELLNSNAILQDKNIAKPSDDTYGGVFDDYSTVLNVSNFDSSYKILDNYIIFAGEHKIKPIPLNMPNNDIIEPTPIEQEETTGDEINIEYGE